MEELLKVVFTLIVVFPFFAGASYLILRKLLYICGPNEVLVFSGRPSQIGNRTVGYRIVKGGRGWRTPLIEQVNRVDLSNMAVEVAVTGAYSKGGIPLNVQGVANLKIAGVQPMLDNALQRFLGRDRKVIIQVAKETLEGNLRGVLSQLTPEEVNEDKLTFAEKLQEEAEQDLRKLGLTLDVLKIQNVSDDVGYLDSIGRQRSASLVQRARTAEAQAKALAIMRDAEARQRARLAEFDAEIEIARAQTEKRIADAKTRREALIAEERGQVQAAVARAESELEVQQARIEQVRRQLAADVLAPARAEMEALQAEAKGRAAKITEDGRATALVLEEMIRTWQNGGENARDIFLMQKLQSVMGALVNTIQGVHVDRMTVLPNSDGRASQAVQLVEELKAGLGVDLPQIINSLGARPQIEDRNS